MLAFTSSGKHLHLEALKLSPPLSSVLLIVAVSYYTLVTWKLMPLNRLKLVTSWFRIVYFPFSLLIYVSFIIILKGTIWFPEHHPGVLSDNEWIYLSSSVMEQLWHFRNNLQFNSSNFNVRYTQGYRPVFSLKSWMSPSNCMIYLSAQVKRFCNVVKWHSPFLVSANTAMSILINELEKLCFPFFFF